MGVQIGSYCSYVQHFINKTIPFRASFFKHSKLVSLSKSMFGHLSDDHQWQNIDDQQCVETDHAMYPT